MLRATVFRTGRRWWALPCFRRAKRPGGPARGFLSTPGRCLSDPCRRRGGITRGCILPAIRPCSCTPSARRQCSKSPGRGDARGPGGDYPDVQHRPHHGHAVAPNPRFARRRTARTAAGFRTHTASRQDGTSFRWVPWPSAGSEDSRRGRAVDPRPAGPADRHEVRVEHQPRAYRPGRAVPGGAVRARAAGGSDSRSLGGPAACRATLAGRRDPGSHLDWRRSASGRHVHHSGEQPVQVVDSFERHRFSGRSRRRQFG